MKIKTISIGKTFNLGNYESFRIDLSAEIEENEDVQQSMLKLTKEIKKFYQDHKR